MVVRGDPGVQTAASGLLVRLLVLMVVRSAGGRGVLVGRSLRRMRVRMRRQNGHPVQVVAVHLREGSGKGLDVSCGLFKYPHNLFFIIENVLVFFFFLESVYLLKCKHLLGGLKDIEIKCIHGHLGDNS